MRVFVESSGKKEEIHFKGTGGELLKKLKINPEEVLLACNGTIITEDTLLKDADEMSILSVVSGG